jgi:hypothetical protein
VGFVLTGTKGCLDETNIYNIDDVASRRMYNSYDGLIDDFK